MNYFTRITTSTNNPDKRNIVIMGRKTWDTIPKKFKPLPNRINFVLSKSVLDFKEYKDVYGFNSLKAAVKYLEEGNMKEQFEHVWVIGGGSVYKVDMEYKNNLL